MSSVQLVLKDFQKWNLHFEFFKESNGGIALLSFFAKCR